MTSAPARHGLNEYIEKYLTDYKHDNIVLVIGRSKNQNIVVYEALLAGAVLDAAKPIEGYWLDIDPEYMAANRAKGKHSDRDELGMIEASVAYGVHFKARGDGSYEVTLVSVPGRVFILALVDGRPRLRTPLAGKDAYVSRVYVESKERFIGPKVLWVDLFGVEVGSGAPVTERVTP